MHLLTALDERSGVKSSSAISTQPSERTANRIGRSVSDLRGKLRRLDAKSKGNRKPRAYVYGAFQTLRRHLNPTLTSTPHPPGGVARLPDPMPSWCYFW